MNTYIIIGPIAGYISGAPIYWYNKLRYLEECGWKAVILPTGRGEVLVHGLEKYAKGSFPCLLDNPSTFSKRQQDAILTKVCDAVGEVDGSCIVETGTDGICYWGELIARRLRARHVVFFLDENNERAHEGISFFQFKFQRDEFAAINPIVAKRLLCLPEQEYSGKRLSFRARCTNSVQEFENELSISIRYGDFNIGSIGRLEKAYVPQIVEGAIEFAEAHKELDILLVFLGGGPNDEASRIRSACSGRRNLRVLVSGYMWPLPLSVVRRMDVFVSASGSASIPAQHGIPSIMMDVTGAGPIGFQESDVPQLIDTDVSERKPLAWYFEQVLCGNVTKKEDCFSEAEQWSIFRAEFQRQVNSVLELKSALDYFDTTRSPRHSGTWKRLLGIRLLGVHLFYFLRSAAKNHSLVSFDAKGWE